MNDTQARALVAAGRLLQSRGWPGGAVKIEKLAGETYPEAIARVITSLDASDRDRLRELVQWVMDYERADLR